MSNNVCEDLIVEIFSRLPTKSLLRFRSLSKSLCACIGSPRFIRLHTLRSPKKVMIIHQAGEKYDKFMYTLHTEDQIPYHSYIGITPMEYPFEKPFIHGSCNGILFVYSYKNGIYLFNPSIRRKVIIPHCPSLAKDRHVVVGFGFDTIINDYKILCASTAGSFVYTLKTHTWREIASLTTPFTDGDPYQCQLNGALHWVAKCYSTDGTTPSYSCILAFDLSSEVFSTTELPNPSWKTRQVTIIKGGLAVIQHDGYRWNWVRREQNSASWSAAFVSKVNSYYDRFIQLTSNDYFVNTPMCYDSIVYNPETRVKTKLVDLSDSYRIEFMIKCDESLGLLDMGVSY